jgi:hypothetical protein
MPGARRHPPAPRAATIPRSPARRLRSTGRCSESLVWPFPPDVQARRAEVTRSCSGAASGSDSGSKRGLGRDSNVLPDANSGRIHCSSASIRLHEADHPHSRATCAHLLPPPWRRRARRADSPAAIPRRQEADITGSKRPALSPLVELHLLEALAAAGRAEAEVELAHVVVAA